MPELPEVEALRRHLRPSVLNRRVESVTILKPRVIRPETTEVFSRALRGQTITDLNRSGKFLIFSLKGTSRSPACLVAHLGMTGHIIVDNTSNPAPKHVAVILDLDRGRLVFEDPRQFGRMTMDAASLPRLGPEPLADDFTPDYLAGALAGSRQPVKVRLLDQSLIAGIGNIYASEALHLAGIRPDRPSDKVTGPEVHRLREGIRAVLEQAIESNVAAINAGQPAYYYRDGENDSPADDEFRVYDRAGKPCTRCAGAIVRLVQAGRSSFYCPKCQR